MIVSVKHMLHRRPRPTLRDIPRALLQAALFGAAAGPLIGLFLGSRSETFSTDPAAWLLGSAAGGLTYAVVFYAICALPAGIVRYRLLESGSRNAKPIIIVTGFLGIILALATLLAISRGAALDGRFIRISVVATILAMIWTHFRNAWESVQSEKALAASRAEIKVLQAQINPHFFFNTLNTISALVPVDPAAAQRTLGLLADMSRYTFASLQTELVPLARELEFASTYLEIEKVRFGSRLTLDLPASGMEGLSVPALTIQPLVENAVRHGIARRMQGGTVHVSVHRNGKRFSVRVENDVEAGTPFSEPAFFQQGHALDNIRERLRLIYGGWASIEVSVPRADTVAVTLEAPIQQ